MKELIKKNDKPATPGDILRFWRNIHRVSQMELAMDTDISPKHLSFIETGRSTPSRDLVLKLSQALKLPLRHRNAFLTAAGYSSEYSEEPLEGSNMAIVREALKHMLDKHEPYPAFVINTSYKILLKNRGFDRLVSFYTGESSLEKYDNIIKLLFAEDGLKRFVQDWEKIELFLLSRLWDEIILTQNSELIKLYNNIKKSDKYKSPHPFHTENSLPVLTIAFEKNESKAEFFSTITTLGTPLDLTAQELRIESLYPADRRTKEFFC